MSKKTKEQLNKQFHKFIDEPNMSDKTLLVSVEDLINVAFGTTEQNTVNFKMIQMVLHILARQMRLLEQDVEIKCDEIGGEKKEKKDKKDEYQQYSEDSSADIAEDSARTEDREEGGSVREETRGEKKSKDRDKSGRSKDRDKEDRGGSKETGKSGERGGRGGKGGERDEGRGGGQERKQDGDRDGERGGERGADRESDRGGGRGGDRSSDRGGGRGGDKSADRGGKGGKGGKGGERGGEYGKKGTPDHSEPGSQGRSPGKESSRTSIIVTEADRKGGKGAKDKILVVEKGPTTRTDSRTRVGSIEVVTASQFALLENAVKQLMTVAGPLPMPALPDNAKLRKDLAKGTASLTETMQAMQLNARVQAAEQALTRMAGLLTQLAAAGALPKDMTNRLGEFEAELQQAAAAAATVAASVTADTHPVSAGGVHKAAGAGPHGTGTGPGGAGGKGHPKAAGGGGPGGAGGVEVHGGAGGVEVHGGAGGAEVHGGAGGAEVHGEAGTGSGRKSVAIDAPHLATGQTGSRPDSARSDQKSGTTSSRSSVSGRVSVGASAGMGVGVSHPEMDDVLQVMKERLLKDIAGITAKATNASEAASNTAKSVAEKLDIALKLDKRINVLYSQTADYAEQLSGFDSGLTTQMASFQEQMLQMRTDLKGGLTQLDQANNNAETTALGELTERYEGLVIELDNTLHAHQSLTALQRQLSEELRSLVECVENLREQKADRDEVFDGLRDKADISRLAGLLHEDDFRIARLELENRLEMCYDKFRKQDRVWLGAIADLTLICEGKAEILELLSIKDNATDELKKIQEILRKLYVMLGEPKAAMLTRKLAKDAVCAGCLAPALMEPVDINFGKPFPLPSLRPPPLGEETCLTDVNLPPPPDAREHVCRRWVGGSHTLVADNVTRVRAGGMPQLQVAPTKRYTGYGTDGRLYMLEEELHPCLECNMLSAEKQAGGAGATGDAVGAGGAGGAGDQAGAAPPPAPRPSGDVGTGDQGKNHLETDNAETAK